MRHRFHSICPYFAMFPEAFVKQNLAARPHSGIVFDPFCGRGTTVFEALLQGRDAAGCDANPVAVCISGAKCAPPSFDEARMRVNELRRNVRESDDGEWQGGLGEFFQNCFHHETLRQVRYLRSELDWRNRSDDRFIAALCLAALHGESHRSPNCFSNRMPRRISTKPDYSLRWWRRKGYEAPKRNVFDILENMLAYRFKSPPPKKRGRVVQADVRKAGKIFVALKGQVTDVITSPPYLDTTNYHEDQWLRVWFLGGAPKVLRGRGDDRHVSKEIYWTFMREAITGFAPLLADRARIAIRIGGRRMEKTELRTGLLQALKEGLGREIDLLNEGDTSEVANTQANAFRGAKASPVKEHDFYFAA